MIYEVRLNLPFDVHADHVAIAELPKESFPNESCNPAPFVLAIHFKSKESSISTFILPVENYTKTHFASSQISPPTRAKYNP
jgi:hypothetical protein